MVLLYSVRNITNSSKFAPGALLYFDLDDHAVSRWDLLDVRGIADLRSIIIQIHKNDTLLIIQLALNKCIDQIHLKLSDFNDLGVILKPLKSAF